MCSLDIHTFSNCHHDQMTRTYFMQHDYRQLATHMGTDVGDQLPRAKCQWSHYDVCYTQAEKKKPTNITFLSDEVMDIVHYYVTHNVSGFTYYQ